MKKITLGLLIIINIISEIHGQVLEGYILTALESNLALKQKQTSYEKSTVALKEARGMFFPDLSFNARYSVAEGGRTIEFPVGDMLNGVYNSLNAINPSFGLPAAFPQLENQEFQFYRPREHETKLRLVQPIINNEIYYNQLVKKDLVNVERSDMETYRRQLVYEVKSAFFIYWQTVKVIDLINETEILLKENIRVNDKLFENNIITIDIVYKSRSELSKLEQKRAEAIQNNQMARSYFNFLLNRDLQEKIDPDSSLLIFSDTLFNLDEAILNSMENREELKKIEYYQSANHHISLLNKSNGLPNLMGVVDYGFQGEEYSFSTNDDFIMASLVLQWDLFKGFQNQRKVAQARMDEMLLLKKQQEVKQMINLEVANAYYGLEAAGKSVDAAQSTIDASSKAFDLVKKKYEQGQSPFIEFMDARTELTNAKQNLIIAQFTYLIKYAEYERVACLYQFKVDEQE